MKRKGSFIRQTTTTAAALAILGAPGFLHAQRGTQVEIQTAPATADASGDFSWYEKYYQTTQDILLRSTQQKNNYIVKTFEIENTDAIELQSYLLRSTAFENAVVEVMGLPNVSNPRTGRNVQFLIVTAPDFMMPGIEDFVAKCDIPGFKFFDGTGGVNEDGIPGALTYVGKHRTASQLVSILEGTELGNVGAFLFPPFADNSLNQIYIVDNPTDIADNLFALEAFDKPPMQVEIGVKVYELKEGDGATLGLDWSAWKRFVSGSGDWAWEKDFGDTTIRSYSAMLSLDAAVLTEFLNYLADDGKANIITETSITAINDFDPSDASGQPGRTSRVFSGSVIPFVTPSSATSDVPVSPERKDIQEGVELLITPYIASETATIDVAVAVSSLIGFVPETHYPIISTQEANSINTVSFGETIIIGGLDKTTMVDHTTGVPLLKDVPVLKYLFGKETTQRSKSKLVIMLTPTLKDSFQSDPAPLAMY